LDALDEGHKFSQNYAVDVYAKKRLVGRVKQGDEPLNASVDIQISCRQTVPRPAIMVFFKS
jgi:hypothetical protein